MINRRNELRISVKIKATLSKNNPELIISLHSVTATRQNVFQRIRFVRGQYTDTTSLSYGFLKCGVKQLTCTLYRTDIQLSIE